MVLRVADDRDAPAVFGDDVALRNRLGCVVGSLRVDVRTKRAQDRLGHKRAVALTLCGWLATVVLDSAAQSLLAFWVAAHVVGLCLGSSQSAGRALIGYLSPHERQGEFFGLWGLAVKLASILGPLSYGAVTWLTDNDHRTAMLITGLFFVLGLAVLATVDPARGRRAAAAA